MFTEDTVSKTRSLEDSPDVSQTVVTKGYLGGNTLDQYLLKDFSSYPSITTAFTAPAATEPADEIEIETSTY